MSQKFIYAVIENPARPCLSGRQAASPSRLGRDWRAGGNGESLSFAEDCSSGLDGAALETVCYRDLAAVVSSIDASRFDPPDKSGSGKASSAQKEESLKADMLRYQQVNFFLLEQSHCSGMLPLRFGFTARDKEQVEEVLGRVYIQLRTYLDRLKGKVELVVQAFWDLPKILQEIREAGDNPELVGADRVKVGRMLFEAAEVRRKKFVEAIHNNLSPFARDFSEGPRKAEAMILNRSYLVEREKEPLFDEAMNFLGTKFEGHLTFRYIGPLPAYSFANIELNQGNFALVDKARRTMQLPEKASWEQIKASYRKLILTHHPDRNPDSPRAEERCKDVVAAYEIVSAYCQSFQNFWESSEGVLRRSPFGHSDIPSGGERRKQSEYSFVKEEVEKVFIVDDKGAVLARGNGFK